jgi:hypothetical protein
MRPTRPDLLPVDDPVAAAVIRTHSFGAQARKIGAGGGFGEKLAPGNVAVKGPLGR